MAKTGAVDWRMGVAKPDNPGANRYDRVSMGQKARAAASWGDADPDKLYKTVEAVTSCGDAIMFSVTRDGGAVLLTVMSGDTRIKRYCADAEEMDDTLDRIRESAKAE